MRRDGSFEYWLGMMIPEDTNVPKVMIAFTFLHILGVSTGFPGKNPMCIFIAV